MISYPERLAQELLTATQHLQALARSMQLCIELADEIDRQRMQPAQPAPPAEADPAGEGHIHLMDFPRAVKIKCDVPGCRWTP